MLCFADILSKADTTGLGYKLKLAPHTHYETILLTYNNALIAFVKVTGLDSVDWKDNTLFLQMKPVRI